MRPRRRGRPFPRRIQQRPRCGGSACTVRMAAPRPPRSKSRPRSPPPARGSHDILAGPERPRRPATSHQGAPAAQREPRWRHESEDARQAPRAVEVTPGDAVESRGALFLGTLPQPVSRQPDVKRLPGTDPPADTQGATNEQIDFRG
jgi:hypothetical protein